MGLIRRLFLGEEQDFSIISLSDSKNSGQTIMPGDTYVSVRLRSAHIKYSRKAWNKLYMCTYARGSLYHENDAGKAEFETVISPSFFRNIDSKNLDKVRSFDRLLFGPFPYIGGLELDIGMFSVKSADLVEPYLDLLEEISGQASIPFVKTAAPFVLAVKKGADALLGRSSDTVLEIGLSRGYDDTALKEGAVAVIRSEGKKVSSDDIVMDSSDYSLMWKGGDPFTEYPYFVYSIITSKQRNDWKRIPDLSEAWKKLNQDIRSGQGIEDSFKAFKTICLLSPDLLEADKSRLIERAETLVDHVTSNEGLERYSPDQAYRLPPFSAIMLYSEDDLTFTNPFSAENLLEDALSFVLRWEGGFSDHPNDPGGATNKGVTQAVYDKWRLKKKKKKQTVRLISDSEVESIYEEEYWKKAKCDRLTRHFDLPLVHFDTAVNMGPTRAAKILQETVGVKRDGIIGDKTLAAVDKISRKDVISGYCDIRERVYRSIAKNRPKLKVFLRGWLNRLNSLRAEIGLDTPESVITTERFMSAPIGHLIDLKSEDELEGFE